LVDCSAYLPFDSEDLLPTGEFEELVRYCEKKPLSLIVGGDSNCHHTVWGSTNCSDRGLALVEFLNSADWEILNWGNDPTFYNSQRLEVIDITLGPCELLESIEDWEVSSEPSLSDQTYYVQISGLSSGRPLQGPKEHQLGLLLGGSGSTLEQAPEMDLKDEAGLGLAISFVQGALIMAYEDNCPLKIGRKGKCPLKLTSNLESLRREVRRLFNKGCRNGTPQSWELYKEAQRRYRK
jgi:hypothetical protein